MNTREAIRLNIDCAHMICQGYLADLTDAELLVRPVPGANHIAWQLGHLLVSERNMVEDVCPGSMPALPAGFAEKYTSETASLDAPTAFHTKSVYMDLYERLRSGTLQALEKLTDADLDKPVPEKMREYVKSVGDLFSLQGTHWVMHGGQWAIVRRKLGRKPLF
jgi:DinB superfamily